MDSEYPPLPSAAPKAAGASKVLLSRDATPTSSQSPASEEPSLIPNGSQGVSATSSGSRLIYKVISDNGDVIIEYTDEDEHSCRLPSVRYQWQVSSDDLMNNSPYFAALLDPNKFFEGRTFMERKAELNRQSELQVRNGDSEPPRDAPRNDLPTVKLNNVDRLPRKHKTDVIGLFLKILSFDSLSDSEKDHFDGELQRQSPSLIAGLIEIADLFNSPHIVRVTLKRSGYAFGRGKVPLTKFNSALLKLSEERVRQIIFIAIFLDEHNIFQILTHTLIVLGSKSWANEVGVPDPGSPSWWYLPNGIEEELYYRRQCVLNTITDLQAHFLRIYGALEDPSDPKSSVPNPTSMTQNAAPGRTRPFQCRWGFSNSRACDAFHLGEMTRFFAMRTKTIFLGSTLIDPGFSVDPGDDSNLNNIDPAAESSSQRAAAQQQGPPADITAIIASLKQCPDYQIDSNHTGCGIRRRLLPALDCIERFVGDGRGLLGPVLRFWKSPPPTSASSWMNRSLRRAETIDIRYSKIISVNCTPSDSLFPGPLPPGSTEEDARLFFTAKKRNWET
ncbi:hypothetical protein VTN00DRAFT_9455 [Thermoascus crustaceus]|uniref:uncharacterized protein n=1 Tax=Thermoascus crustaceus TaxID=5088 RepID=UPI0037434193